jgi:hypothetical protein
MRRLDLDLLADERLQAARRPVERVALGHGLDRRHDDVALADHPARTVGLGRVAHLDRRSFGPRPARERAQKGVDLVVTRGLGPGEAELLQPRP